MTKKLLGFIGLIFIWIAIVGYFWFWGFILDFFEKLFKSGDPLGWSGVIAMFVIIYTGMLIYLGIKFTVEKIQKRR